MVYVERMDQDHKETSPILDPEDPGKRLRELTERLENVTGNLQDTFRSLTGHEVTPSAKKEEPQDLQQIIERIKVVGENLQKIDSKPQEELEKVLVGATSEHK